MRLTVARIGKAHGIRGEVTIEIRTDSPEERFLPGSQLFVTDGARRRELVASGLPTTLTITSARPHKNTILLGFIEIGDRNTAEAMRDVILECDIAEEEETEEEAWYDHQLVGLQVFDVSGDAIGEILSVDHLPAQDVLVIRRESGVKAMVPFVSALVPEVDVDQRRVVINAQAGLIDMDA